MITLTLAVLPADAAVITLLFKEYAAELHEDLCFQGFAEELNEPFKKYPPPAACIYIAWYNQLAAGCIALQPLPGAGVCEMKRLYVRPAFRASGVGARLVQKLLEAATERAYKSMVLDTLARLQPAIRLYQRFGFTATSAYYANPLAGVVYMQKVLNAP